MDKGKDIRIIVILKCSSSIPKGVNKESTVISRYFTQKNRDNTLNQLELRKFCRYCQKYMINGEIKKYMEQNACVIFLRSGKRRNLTS